MHQHYRSLTISLFRVLPRTMVEGVIPLWRDAVGAFYSPSWLGHEDTDWGSYAPLPRCSRCILQPQLTESNNFYGNLFSLIRVFVRLDEFDNYEHQPIHIQVHARARAHSHTHTHTHTHTHIYIYIYMYINFNSYQIEV